MGIEWPSNTTEIIDAIRGAIGADVVFYTVTVSGEPSSVLNPFTNQATVYSVDNAGKYWTPTYSGVTISGHITQKPSDYAGKDSWATGGQVFDGDLRVQVKYTEGNLQTIEATKYLVIPPDDKQYEIKKKDFRGKPTPNRIVLVCEEYTK